jgi:hypothetical protein
VSIVARHHRLRVRSPGGRSRHKSSRSRWSRSRSSSRGRTSSSCEVCSECGNVVSRSLPRRGPLASSGSLPSSRSSQENRCSSRYVLGSLSYPSAKLRCLSR